MNRVALAVLVAALCAVGGSVTAADELKSDQLVNLELKDVDARTALEALFRTSGRQYIIESGVGGTIAGVSFKDVSFEVALRQLTRSAGLAYRVGEDGVYNVAVRPTPAVREETPQVATPEPLVEVKETVIERIPLYHSGALEILQALQKTANVGGVVVTSGSAIGGFQSGVAAWQGPTAAQGERREVLGIPRAGQFQRGVPRSPRASVGVQGSGLAVGVRR